MRCRRSSRCSFPAGTRCCSMWRRGAAIACSAPRATMPPAKPSTRSRSCSACHIPAVRTSSAPPRPAIRRASASAGRWCARTRVPGDGDYYDLSFSGLKTAVRLATQKVDVGDGARESRARIPGCAHRHARGENFARRPRERPYARRARRRRRVQPYARRANARAAGGGWRNRLCSIGAARHGQRRDDRPCGTLPLRGRRARLPRRSPQSHLFPFPAHAPHDRSPSILVPDRDLHLHRLRHRRAARVRDRAGDLATRARSGADTIPSRSAISSSPR